MGLKKGDGGKFHEEKSPRAKLGAKNRTLAASMPAGGKTIIGSEGDSTLLGQDALDKKTRIAGWGNDGDAGSGKGAGPTGRSGTQKGDGTTDGSATGFLKGQAPTQKTQLHGVPGQTDAEQEAQNAKVSEDPVVGWLVVVDGPGKGYSLPVGMGMNSVGRGADQRIAINFGDVTISSSKHFFVSYDPRAREFGVHRGDGANLTYLNGAPIYGSERLESFAQIEVGATTLKFVALCGEQFSWEA